MSLVQIFFFVFVALFIKWVLPNRFHSPSIFVATVGGVAWMFWDYQQSVEAAILYFATVSIVFWVWYISNDLDESKLNSSQLFPVVVALVIGIILLIVGFRAVGEAPAAVGFISIILLGTLGASLMSLRERLSDHAIGRNDWLTPATIAMLILILIIIKLPALAGALGLALVWSAPDLSAGTPFVWLGFSYLAFRLLAILLDYRAGRIPQGGFALRHFISYTIFFPAFTAGPIDRAQRFVPELESDQPLTSSRFVEGIGRVIIGLAKKFIIADTLALISLQPTLINETRSIAGLWLLLYLYSFQIYLDFSGYSDIAIGIGRLLGITLPENFDRPYLQRNLQQFWQRWHMTLSTWFRIYFFTPYSRMLIRSKIKPPQWVIILITQVCTMVLIGLWHGITFNFVVWGLWHGLGLFAHKMFADYSRSWFSRNVFPRWTQYLGHVVSIIVTFHFVTIAWLFFALPEFNQSWNILTRLFGMDY